VPSTDLRRARTVRRGGSDAAAPCLSGTVVSRTSFLRGDPRTPEPISRGGGPSGTGRARLPGDRGTRGRRAGPISSWPDAVRRCRRPSRPAALPPPRRTGCPAAGRRPRASLAPPRFDLRVAPRLVAGRALPSRWPRRPEGVRDIVLSARCSVDRCAAGSPAGDVRGGGVLRRKALHFTAAVGDRRQTLAPARLWNSALLRQRRPYLGRRCTVERALERWRRFGPRAGLVELGARRRRAAGVAACGTRTPGCGWPCRGASDWRGASG